MKKIQHFINGEYTASASDRWFDDVNPANGEVIAQVAEGGAAEIDAAVKAARAALKGEWGNMPIARRMELLHKVADGIKDRFE